MIFFTVFKQVFILLLLIALGFLLTKRKIFTDAGVKSMTELVLLFVTPCVIIKSFIREYDPATLKYILISFAAAVGIHLLFIITAHLLFRSKDQRKNCVLRFGVVFTNCGYMSLPLQEAVLGADGVLYGASFIAIFNLIVWSYGITLMSGDKKYIS
ncbi:MAG: AEC family transporter, partial [Clostridia bacterium]|nr:AEC family transporter [Clostridia bacterium]